MAGAQRSAGGAGRPTTALSVGEFQYASRAERRESLLKSTASAYLTRGYMSLGG